MSIQVDEMDSGEKRLNELGYKQELRREMTLFKTLAISFSTMTLFTGITPLYGSSLLYAGPATLVWGWVVVSFFFTWFVGIAMAKICSSFPITSGLHFWTAHLAGPKWGPFASWCCAWLETIGLIAGIGTQAYAGSQTLQSIILLCTRTNEICTSSNSDFPISHASQISNPFLGLPLESRKYESCDVAEPGTCEKE